MCVCVSSAAEYWNAAQALDTIVDSGSYASTVTAFVQYWADVGWDRYANHAMHLHADWCALAACGQDLPPTLPTQA
jgi:hypothetical protein